MGPEELKWLRKDAEDAIRKADNSWLGESTAMVAQAKVLMYQTAVMDTRLTEIRDLLKPQEITGDGPRIILNDVGFPGFVDSEPTSMPPPHAKPEPVFELLHVTQWRDEIQTRINEATIEPITGKYLDNLPLRTPSAPHDCGCRSPLPCQERRDEYRQCAICGACSECAAKYASGVHPIYGQG